MQIERTALPGIGVSHTLTTERGIKLSVISHNSGRRELVIHDQDDPDSVRCAVSLEAHAAHHLADLLHATFTVDHIADLEEQLPGIEVAKLPIAPGSPYDGRAVADLLDGTRTRASIVAVVRGGEVVYNPDPDYTLDHHDTVVAVGPSDSVEALSRHIDADQR